MAVSGRLGTSGLWSEYGEFGAGKAVVLLAFVRAQWYMARGMGQIAE